MLTGFQWFSIICIVLITIVGGYMPLFILFACSTPAGIVIGQDIHQYLSGNAMFLVKGLILSLAAGTFLYISTLHELRHTPLIENCCSRKGFFMMICGFVITALVRLLLGEAHHM